MSVGSDEEPYEEKSRIRKRKVKAKANPKPKQPKTAVEIALKKEMHRRCESVRICQNESGHREEELGLINAMIRYLTC